MNHVRTTGKPACRDLPLSLLLGFTALALAGCSSLSQKMPWSDSDPVDYSLISENLVDAVGQYPRLNPLMATVQVSAPDNALERQVHEEMRSRGYKVEKVNADKGELVVDAHVQRAGSDSADAAPLYVLAVGPMSVERRYKLVDGQMQPSSQMVVRGADERILVLNDEELFPYTEARYSSVLFQPDAEPATVTLDEPIVATPEIAAAIPIPTPATEQGPVLIKQNLYDNMGQSNYSALFADFEEVESSVLVFPNDSLQLGDVNKQIIEQYVEKMDPSTDVLSVIGCSHGTTEINNGNSLLAVGRANRVKEAFMFSGIDHDLVMEEGCWAPVPFESLPSRGVVLTLKRRSNS